MTQVCFDVPVYDPDYEVVAVEISTDNENYTNEVYVDNNQHVLFDADIQVSAPSGKKVVGGGFEFVSEPGTYSTDNRGVLRNGPSSDGSFWGFKGKIFCDNSGIVWNVTPGKVFVKVYAICLAV